MAASKFIDVCRFNPTSGGTTDFTYSSAVTGYQSPALAGISNGATYSYRAENASLSEWEIGTGTYNTGTGVLTRGTVLYNSAGTGTGAGQSGAGSKISFSTTPQVAIVALAEDLFVGATDSQLLFPGTTAAIKVSGTTLLDYGVANASYWTFAAGLMLSAGTTSIAPLKFASGSNLTTAAIGACEFDGSVFYQTAVASARQVVDTEQIQILSAGRTFSINTSAQAIFNATANGAITLAGSTTYEFEMWLMVTGLSASSHGINIGFAGTATFTAISYHYLSNANSTTGGPNTGSQGGFITVATASVVIANATTTTGCWLMIRGTMRINAGGTVIPQLTQVSNATAAVVQPGSFFRCWPIGSGSVTNVGNWS
jgi:hypothetical protein